MSATHSTDEFLRSDPSVAPPTATETTVIKVEHVRVVSNRAYEKVVGAFEARLGPAVDWNAILQQLKDSKLSRERFAEACERHIGPAGLTLFYKVSHRPYSTLLGGDNQAIQYTVGNPLLASQMTQHMPEVALYAPFKVLIWQRHESKTIIAYDNFVSLLSQFQGEEIARTAREVQRRLEALVAHAAGISDSPK